jgi:hypothetical protein
MDCFAIARNEASPKSNNPIYIATLSDQQIVVASFRQLEW